VDIIGLLLCLDLSLVKGVLCLALNLDLDHELHNL